MQNRLSSITIILLVGRCINNNQPNMYPDERPGQTGRLGVIGLSSGEAKPESHLERIPTSVALRRLGISSYLFSFSQALMNLSTTSTALPSKSLAFADPTMPTR